MFFDLSILEILIIFLFLATSVSCAVSYSGCVKILADFEKNRKISTSVNKLRVFDQYVLSKMTSFIALFYFILSYILFSKMTFNSFSFFFACVASFAMNLITTFFSRINYCYTCNVVLETKLNELECFVINLKNLLSIYSPFIISSFVIPCVYLLDLEVVLKHIVCVVLLLFLVCLWVLLSPKIIVWSNGAKKMKKNYMLRYRLEQLFDAHDIKKYELYYWDTSRSKEANAMVSGIRKYHLLVSTYLIESVTLPELESIILHEIGHIKNNHIFKMMIGKLISVVSLIFMILVSYWFDLNDFYRIVCYILAGVVGVLELVASIGVEKRYELEADSYANSYSDPGLFASALKKVTKYEYEEINSIDELFQTHCDVQSRINYIEKDD